MFFHFERSLMLKSVLLFLFGLIVVVFILAALFVNFAPQFGADFDDTHKRAMQMSPQYVTNQFVNQEPTAPGLNEDSNMFTTLLDYIKGTPNQKPKTDLEVEAISSRQLLDASEPNLIWFGHSSFLLSINHKRIFFDPVFSQVPAPHPWLGSKRYNSQPPITPENLPEIDAVVISHDHYDHLDYDSVKKMDNKVKQYFVPMGVAEHLVHWGVDMKKIVEFNWWQNTEIGELTLTFTPARHFSGRRLTNQNQTLWGGWFIKSNDFSMFYSGDTGYGKHFKEIYNKLGAPDIALLECGQYNQAWSDIHMMPEQTVQAANDLKAGVMMPVHWGSFTLALHSWTDPIERAIKAAEQTNQKLVAPKIGEIMLLSDTPAARENWWQNY